MVSLHKRAAKQLRDLPEVVRVQVNALMEEIRVTGPVTPQWKNFGRLKGKTDCWHCHVKSGRPTYVVCWEVKKQRRKNRGGLLCRNP